MGSTQWNRGFVRERLSIVTKSASVDTQWFTHRIGKNYCYKVNKLYAIQIKGGIVYTVLCGICNKHKPVRVGNFSDSWIESCKWFREIVVFAGFFWRILTMHRNNPLRWSKSLSDLHNKNVNFWQNVLDSQVRKPSSRSTDRKSDVYPF